MKSQRKRWLNLIMGASVFITVGSGVSANETYQPFDLGEVVVSAQSTGQEGPSTVSGITADDIERYNASSLGDALKLIPGVHLRQGRTKEGFYITLRGHEQEKVLVLLDGIPIGVPYEGLVNLSDIPVENIAAVKVVKGNASVLYGPNATGGVVNVITKKGSESPSFLALYKASDYNSHYLSATHGGQIGKLSYFLGASHKQSDGWELADSFTLPSEVLNSMAVAPANPGTVPNVPVPTDSGKRENSDLNKNSATFTGSLELTPENTLGLSMEYYNHEYGIPAVPIIRDHRRGFFYFPRYWRFSNWERFTSNLIDEYRITPEFRTKIRVFYDDYDNTLEAYDGPDYATQDRIGPPSGPGDYDDYSSGAQLQTFWDILKNNQFRTGITFKRDVHKENFQNGPFDTMIAHTWSAAIEDEYQLADKAAVTAGVSYDVFDKRKLDLAGQSGSDHGKDIYSVNPQIGIIWYVSDVLNAYGSVGKKSRFPTMRNLYADGVVGPAGNPDLEEEESRNYELGLTWSISDRTRFEMAVFYSDIDNLINFDNILGRFEQYENAEIKGFEVGVNTGFGKGLTAGLNYTFLETGNNSLVTIDNEFHDDLVYKPNELPYRPRHKIDLDLSKKFISGFQIDLTGSYFSKQRYYDHFDPADNTHLVSTPGWLDDYVLFNIRLSQKFTKRSEVFIAGENILNENYEDIVLVPGRGRILWAGVKLSM